MPVHCWKCWTDSPAESVVYQQYQDCIEKNHGYHVLGVSLIVLMILALILAWFGSWNHIKKEHKYKGREIKLFD